LRHRLPRISLAAHLFQDAFQFNQALFRPADPVAQFCIGHIRDSAACCQAMREAMLKTVKRHSFWYLVQAGLMILAGILALVYPAIASFAVVFLLGCVLTGPASRSNTPIE
jgi:hypothetical protein